MKLEAGQGQYARAVLTGEKALQKAENSESILDLTEKYRQELEGEPGRQRTGSEENVFEQPAGESEAGEEEKDGRTE